MEDISTLTEYAYFKEQRTSLLMQISKTKQERDELARHIDFLYDQIAIIDEKLADYIQMERLEESKCKQ